MRAAPGAGLEVTDLQIDVRGRCVVDGVSFTVAAGQRTAVVGASGSGKSLTAAAVLGQLPVGARATGSIRVAGHEVLGRPAPRRPPAARPSMVFQDSSAALNPLVRVGAQVAEPLRRRHGDRARARQEARGLDDAFKLSRWSTAETLVVLDDAGDAQPGLSTSWARWTT